MKSITKIFAVVFSLAMLFTAASCKDPYPDDDVEITIM